MSEEPKNGQDPNGPDQKGDYYSGIPWVYVDPAQARAHPKGQLTPVLFVIGLYLVGIGLWKAYVFADAGYALGVVILGGILPVLAGAGLLLRMPWAIVVTIVMAGFTLYSFARNLRADPDPLLLVDALVAVGVIFYLVEGERPNFIYRHRYRKYSVEDDDA